MMEYYSEMKRNDLLSYAKKWRKLRFLLLSERSKSEKASECVISKVWCSEKG